MIDLKQIEESVNIVAKEFPIRKVELFGSYACGTNTDKSDIDLLVEFSTSAISLLIISALKFRLEELTGTEVDIIHAPVNEDSLLEIGKVVQIYEA